MKRKEEIKHVAKETFPNEGWEFQRVSFVQGAEWADKTMLERACEYLRNIKCQEFPGAPYQRLLTDEDINDFKKAMEE